MAKKKTERPVIRSAELIGNFLEQAKKDATSAKGYLAGDHAQHTWGLPIPHLAFQWLIGGSNVLPLQRCMGISGKRKSYKSTLVHAIGNWFINPPSAYDNHDLCGVHVALDSENKTSPDMMDAISRGGLPTLEMGDRQRMFVPVTKIEQWQNEVTRSLKLTRAVGYNPPGERFPVLASIDSLMGKQTEAQAASIEESGHAEARQYPVGHAAVTNYLEGINLHGTPIMLCWVQHMKENIDAGTPMKTYREKGASAAAFAVSIHLRVKRGKDFKKVNHPARFVSGPDCVGTRLTLETALSCVGPQGRKLEVDLLWQYIDQVDEETGEYSSPQYMKYDWHGALGDLLVGAKYGAKKWSQGELARLTDKEGHPHTYLEFTMSGSNVNCAELELSDATTTEFGAAIEANPVVRDRISKLLRISQFPTYQEADIDVEE